MNRAANRGQGSRLLFPFAPVFALAVAFFMLPAGIVAAQQEVPAVKNDTAAKKSGDKKKSPKEQIDDLFARLKVAKDAKSARRIENQIQTLWNRSGSDTVDLIMARARQAKDQRKFSLAHDNLDFVISLAPLYAEGWNQRAHLHYLAGHYRQAVGDIERTLSLEPRHFGAMAGLINILGALGMDKRATEFAERLAQINPHSEVARDAIKSSKNHGDKRPI